ncbi:type I secretion system permease/ATPase [Bosea sp. BH3]|uniref:type I secretion system permease/ATPase n=1 Tax=Bosea sp. BH3 TaxID=2871701 RepID=UPI0021CB11E8|nr:type I secretion system permease/ATPase [Bosea sp. BH3]MCU4181140.1 type I secretion system permease/ATPase [Bosea sp. BH3]
MSTSVTGRPGSTEVRAALWQCARWFGWIALFSAIINILYLAGSVYMLQVYDRVLASRSTATLVALSLIVLAIYLFQAGLDALRSRMLARLGAHFDELLSPRAYQLVAELPLRDPRQSQAVSPTRDIDQIRNFLGGLGPTALFDLPFLPIFVTVAFMLHPWLGWMTIFGAVVIVMLTAATEYSSRSSTRSLVELSVQRQNLLESTRRNAEAITALGMLDTFRRRYLALSERVVAQALRGTEVTGGIAALAKAFRLALQSAAVGLGAYLAIHGEISSGSIIAASILCSRALAPIETAITHWRGFVAARQGYARLQHYLELMPLAPEPLALPAPTAHLQAEDIVVVAPGTTSAILKSVSFQLKAGDAIGIIGPTGSGKSTLARALVGAWKPARGCLRLDGADFDQWGRRLNQHVGYLPQDIELFEGTVAQNIARFAENASPTMVLAAAFASGAHETILNLPQGYETNIGEGGAALSGGQRQRIALARALYGDPFLVVLDEPNANLDGKGDEALSDAIRSVRQRGGIAVIVTHRPPGLKSVNLVAVLSEGRIASIGPRDEVLQSLSPAIPRPPAVPATTSVKAAAA